MRFYAFFVMFLMTLRIRAYSISAPVSTRGLSARVINRRSPISNTSFTTSEKYPFLTYTTPNSGPTPRLSFSTSTKMGSKSPAASPTASAFYIPYWNMNLPQSEWTDECPDFLDDMNPKDIKILATAQIGRAHV